MHNAHNCSEYSFETKAIHTGQSYDQWSNNEVVPPIVTSATFYQSDPTKAVGYCYGRGGSPTRSVLQRNIAALDNAKYCLTFPSGSAALTTLLHTFKPFDHIICSSETYGGTRAIFLHCVVSQGISIDFVDVTCTESVEKAIKSNTKLIWIETPTNPCLRIADMQAIADIAHDNDRNIIFAVDNTILTSYFQRPLEFGADLVIYSLTKYMNGHNDVFMGALVTNNEKLFSELEFIQGTFGIVPSAFDCYHVIRSLKTLAIRMDQHFKNGLVVARYLESHPHVVKVKHPSLESHPQYDLAKKQSSGQCGLVTFQLNGSVKEVKTFVQSLRLIISCPSLGDVDSFVSLPAFGSHLNLPEDVRRKLDILDTTVRLSVGIENADDIICDLEKALNAAYDV